MKLIKTKAFKIHMDKGDWDNFIADSIEEAIKLCREEYPNNNIFSVEYMGTCKRSSVKTVTIEV